MATTLLNKVRAITKSTTTLGVSDDNVLDSLTAGARFVMATAPKQFLYSYAEAFSVEDANGYAYEDDTVLTVERDGSVATPIENARFYAENVTGASSLYAKSKLFPGFYILRGKIYVKPDPASGEAATFSRVKVPTIISGTVNVFGILEEAVIQYACALDLSSLANIFRDSAITELETITSSGYLADFEGAVPSYTSIPSPSLPSTPSIGTLPTAPSEPVLPSYPDDVTLPTIPTAPDMSVFPSGVSLPTVELENPLPVIPSSSLAVPAFTFVEPTASLDYDTMDSNIASDDVEVAQTVSQKLSAQINELQAKTQIQQTSIEEQVKEYQATVSRFSAEWQSYQQESASLLQDFSTRVQNYSSEAQSLLGEYSADVQKISSKIQSDLNKYSSEVQAYSSEAQALVSDYGARTGAVTAESQTKIAKYGTDVQKYVADVNRVVSVLNAEVQVYSAEGSQILQKYSGDVQSSVSDFQSNMAIAMSYLSEAGVRLQTMNQYSQLSADATNKASGHYLFAYRFMETHVTKFLGVQQDASA